MRGIAAGHFAWLRAYYPVKPLAIHPFINEGEVLSCGHPFFFPFIDEEEVLSCDTPPFFPFIDEGVDCDVRSKTG